MEIGEKKDCIGIKFVSLILQFETNSCISETTMTQLIEQIGETNVHSGDSVRIQVEAAKVGHYNGYGILLR